MFHNNIILAVFCCFLLAFNANKKMPKYFLLKFNYFPYALISKIQKWK